MGLKQKTMNGLAWAGISQGGKLISHFTITVILARLLNPGDFGLLAMATVFSNFVAIFSEMGVSSALIQKQDTHDRHYHSAFWLNIFVGLCLTVFFIIVSPLIASFYKKPELTRILMVIALNYFLSSFVIVQQTILTKEMDFKKLALRDVAAVILSGAVGIYMAYNGFGVWSLVYQLLSFTVFNACLLWLLSSWRPRFEFAMADIRDIFHFSANLTGFEIVNYFSRNIDQLLIGKFLGSQVLGYYSIAYKIMLLPLQNISWVAGRVMFPAFSRIQDDLEKVRKTYMKMAKAISLATFPIMLGLFAMAPEMVHVVLGLKWEPVVILLRIFSVCGMIQSVGTTVGNIFLSQHRADMVFHLSIVSSLIVGVSVAVGLRWGINGVALCYTLQALVWSHAVLIFATRLIGLKFSRFYSKLTVSYMIGIIVLAVTLAAKYLIIAPEAYKLGLLVAIWAVTYVIALFATKELSIKNNRPVFSVINENI